MVPSGSLSYAALVGKKPREGSLDVAAIVRMTPAEALAHIDPSDSRLNGELYIDDPAATDAEVEWVRKTGSTGWWSAPKPAHTGLPRSHTPRHYVSRGLLSSEAVTPFVLDGDTYPSVRRFYGSLKVPEGEARARFVGGDPSVVKVKRGGRADATFRYHGATLTVGSLTHLQLIARAVSAKVGAHAGVRAELVATGRARLTMGKLAPLGHVMPFALMIERLRLLERVVGSSASGSPP